MKVCKYRRGIKQKGHWILPDTWKGPFGPQDAVWFNRLKPNKWELQVEFVRNDGDGGVLLTLGREDTFIKHYKLPQWLCEALEDLYEHTGRATIVSIKKRLGI